MGIWVLGLECGVYLDPQSRENHGPHLEEEPERLLFYILGFRHAGLLTGMLVICGTESFC